MFSESMASDMDMFAPNTTTVIDDFKVEEFTSTQPGILPGFQGHNKGTTTVDGIREAGKGEVVEDGNVVQHDLLVCQPCDEDENVEVVAEGKTNSRSKKRKRGMTMEYYNDDGDDNDENVDSWNGDGNSATWHLCKDCDYKAKRKSNLKKHRANIYK